MSPRTDRRDFLKNATALATTAALGTSLTAAPAQAEKKDRKVSDKLVPIVDTHQHLWDLDILTLPWLKNEGVKSIRRSFVMSDYRKATKGLNVVKTVYMEVNVRKDLQEKEADYVIDLCKRDDNPMAAAVIGGHPFADDFAAYAKKYAKNKYIRGVRTVLHDPDRKQGLCLEPKFVENIRLLGKLGMSFDLCMRPGEISDGVKLARKCPDTRFIIDHCGNMSVTETDKKLRKQWMAGMKAAAEQENIVCKISGIVVTAEKDKWKPIDLAPNMNFCMETFGDDRCFFGGDWPVCTLKATYLQWTNALKEIVRERTPKFQRKLFHDNAVRLYRLS
jgi:predicted TIM-barrel fold metal-dependent hydrolase